MEILTEKKQNFDKKQTFLSNKIALMITIHINLLAQRCYHQL